jgi:hypothetical protein
MCSSSKSHISPQLEGRHCFRSHSAPASQMNPDQPRPSVMFVIVPVTCVNTGMSRPGMTSDFRPNHLAKVRVAGSSPVARS